MKMPNKPLKGGRRRKIKPQLTWENIFYLRVLMIIIAFLVLPLGLMIIISFWDTFRWNLPEFLFGVVLTFIGLILLIFGIRENSKFIIRKWSKS